MTSYEKLVEIIRNCKIVVLNKRLGTGIVDENGVKKKIKIVNDNKKKSSREEILVPTL